MVIIVKKYKIVNIVILIVALVAISFGVYFYYKLQNLEKISKLGIQKETQDIILKVSELYLLPSKEEPTVATVSDPEILKNQEFFYLAEKGDKVLIFTKAGKAVLYRPSINKIVEITPITNSSNSLTP